LNSFRLMPLLVASAFAAGTAAGSAATLASGYAADVPHRVDTHDLGRAPARTSVEIAVLLNYRHASELARLVGAQVDPESPLYRHFLSNAQFDAYFAPSPADHARVIDALRRAGFRISGTFENRTIVDAVGPAAVAERYFGTEIHRVAQDGVGIRYANVRPAIMPAELRETVASVSGLSDVDVARVANARPPSPQINGKLRGPDSGYYPTAFADAYDMPVQHGSDGSGRATGVAISGDYLDATLTQWMHDAGIPRTGPATTRVAVDGGAKYNGNPFSPNNASLEATLDVETIVGTTPGTHLYMYLFPNLSSKHIEDGYNRADSDNAIDVLNSSFGGCETTDTAFANATNALAQQGAAKGITFAAATGDKGSNQPGCAGPHVGAPASGPYFVAVGGTALSITGSGGWSSETGWSGSGGGVSKVFPLPSFQQGVSGITPGGRNLPDVSADASLSTGASYLFAGFYFGPIGGTSLSCPLYAGLQTQINQMKHARAGQANARLFAVFASKGYGVFHDITSGSNGAFTARAGYDNVTGIGTPKGFALANAF
jgi:kumamolisin